MKILFKSVFVSFAAMFLTAFILGCSDEGSKIASKDDSASSLESNSGKVKLVLEPGDTGLFFYFKGAEADVAVKETSQTMSSLLKANGIAVEKNLISGDSSLRILFVKLEMPLANKMTLELEKTAMDSFRVLSHSGGDVASWNPSLGNKSKRVSK